jgi:hypothetical protein
MDLSSYVQDYEAASKWLKRGLWADDEICQLARELAVSEKGLGDAIKMEQLVAILGRLDSHEPLALRVLLFDQKQRYSLTDRARIIEAYLRVCNPLWIDGWFEYRPDTNSLRLGGPGLERVATQSSVLIGLNPRVLDLSGSEIKDLNIETGLALEILDVRGTKVEELWFLKSFLHLKQLIVTPGQLSAEQLEILPNRVEVLEKPL